MTPQAPRPASRTSSRTPAVAALLGGVLTLGALAGATAVFSSRTQETTTNFADSLVKRLNATGKVTAQQTGYQKGFASSTQTMTVTIRDTGENWGKPIRLLVTNHIQHGPFPGLKAVGQAVVDTDIRFEDAALQAKMEAALDGQKPTIHTLVGLGGDTHSTITLPSGHLLDEDGGNVTWKSLLGHVNVSGLDTVMDMQWPSLDIQDKKDQGHMLLENMNLQSQQRKLSNTSLLSVGQSTFKMGAVRFVPSEAQKAQLAASNRPSTIINISNLEVSGASTQSADKFMDMSAQYNIGEIGGEAGSLKNVQYHMSLRHLAPEPLEQMVTLLSNLQNTMTEGKNTPDISAAQEKQLESSLAALLKAQPKLTLDRLSLSQPSGDIVFTGEASVPGLANMKPEDLDMARQMPMMLLGSVQVHLDGSASKKALGELDALADGRLNLVSSLEPLVEQGYLTQQGDTLKTAIDYASGKLTMNGKSLGQ